MGSIYWVHLQLAPHSALRLSGCLGLLGQALPGPECALRLPARQRTPGSPSAVQPMLPVYMASVGGASPGLQCAQSMPHQVEYTRQAFISYHMAHRASPAAWGLSVGPSQVLSGAQRPPTQVDYAGQAFSRCTNAPWLHFDPEEDPQITRCQIQRLTWIKTHSKVFTGLPFPWKALKSSINIFYHTLGTLLQKSLLIYMNFLDMLQQLWCSVEVGRENIICPYSLAIIFIILSINVSFSFD